MDRIDVALGVLHSLRVPPDDLKPIVDGDRRIIDSMTWILLHDSRVLEQLKPDFFRAVLSLVRDRISQQATKAALQVLLHACGWGRNRIKIVEAGGVKEIVELELTTTELNLGVLSQLCASADGRAELVGRAAGLTTASKWSLRVSSLADDKGVRILSSPCSYSATTEVLQEMMSVRFCRIRSFQTLMTVLS
ncbi:E3 ubiquitin-protein ligase PUB24-like [Musa acuminata AAA Group]|uniref:E3 ubiquitin-protein ligase PUB24-like n=1 Tax=Musa acuminata AAA Group TaxID=214697 RepID=UPI0031D13883